MLPKKCKIEGCSNNVRGETSRSEFCEIHDPRRKGQHLDEKNRIIVANSPFQKIEELKQSTFTDAGSGCVIIKIPKEKVNNPDYWKSIENWVKKQRKKAELVAGCESENTQCGENE